MARMDRHTSKKSGFKKFYLTYLLVILLCFIALFVYVRSMMLKYERNSPANYVVWLTEDLSDSSQLGRYLKEKNFSDNRFGDGASRKQDLYDKIKYGKVEAKPVKGSYSSTKPAYSISVDGKPLMDIGLNEVSSTTKLGIMTLSDWDIDYCIVRNEASNSELTLSSNNCFDIKVIVPDGFDLVIDGKPVTNLSSSSEMVLPEFEYISEYVDAPKGNVYEINNLYYEPVLSARNNIGESIGFTLDSKGYYTAAAEYKESPEAKALIESFCSPLELGKLWSKYMTDDVGGDRHGRDTVIYGCRLYRGTALYNLAVSWASNVDIQFVSAHTITAWTNENVSNYIQYNDNLASCDVSFDKNMNVVGSKRVDAFRNRMYFGKIYGGWYLLDMVTLDSE